MNAKSESIILRDGMTVSGLWQAPIAAEAALVLAHGAGAGMNHASMTAIADGLAARSISTLRFNFPFTERGSRRPDPPSVAQAAIRAAVDHALVLAEGLPLFAGGKSFGGRMTSQAQAVEPLPGVLGLVFFAFPLHSAGRPGIERAGHLAEVHLPLLFLQGTRDTLAEIDLLWEVIIGLGRHSTLVLAPDADHAFHVLAKFGRDDAIVLGMLLDEVRSWVLTQCRQSANR